MSAALPLIVLGHVYLLAPSANFSSNGLDSTSNSSTFQNFNQLSGPLPQAVRDNGYTYMPDVGAFKFHSQAADWYTALLICREEGGHLAIMNSRAEANAVVELFANAGPHLDTYNQDYAWLGFHDLYGGRGRYETVHGDYVENVGFNEWTNGNRGEFGKYAGVISKTGKLWNFGPHRQFAFVCELPHVPTYVDRRNILSTLSSA